MDIAIDFDGTVVTHEYPKVGHDLEYCTAVLRVLVSKGHRLILNTMRSDKTLQDAVDWFTVREIPLYGVNSHPEQRKWTQSTKTYAHLYIDDAALGCPLNTKDRKPNDRPFVDWLGVNWKLQLMGLYDSDDLLPFLINEPLV